MTIYLLIAIGLTSGDSSTVHIYTQTIHGTTQYKQYIEQHKISEECGPCPVFVSYTLAFALQLSKKHGKTSVLYTDLKFHDVYYSLFMFNNFHISFLVFLSLLYMLAPA
jgi:hypothetical protein